MTTRSLQHARDLLATLVLRDLKLRYKRSLLGVFWTLLHPLAQLAVLFFVFRTVLRVDVPHYAAFLFIGITVWTWLAGALVQATSCVLDDRALIRRPAFPAAVLPVASVTSHAVHFLLTLPVTLGLLACEGRWPGAALGWLPLVVAVQFVATLSVSYALAAVHVRFRDTQYLLGVLLVLGFYLTPIVYELSAVPAPYAGLLAANPMTHLLEAYRDVLLRGAAPHGAALAAVAAFSGALLAGSFALFQRSSARFAEEL